MPVRAAGAGAIKAMGSIKSASWRGSRANITYSHLERTRSSIIASVLFLVLICTTTFTNIYYLLWFRNSVNVKYVDTYAATTEWLFNEEAIGPLDPIIVERFIASDDTNDALRLKNALLTPRSTPITAASPCVARLGQDPGSFYAFCDGLNRSSLPAWANDFDAHIIQTVNLATPAEFRTKRPVLAVMQGFKNTRNGWYEQKTIQQFYCTTRVMAQPVHSYSERIIYTKLHGVLRSVDCSLKNETNGEACRLAAMELPAVNLYDDKTGSMPLVRPNEVLRHSKGKDFILCPFITTETIGALTKALPVWPIDDCLYVRGTTLGWFGAGYMAYAVAIPTSALQSKLQLLALVVMLWLITYRGKIHCVHHALIQASRLGIFPCIAAQMVYAAYWEQDILRTIHSWKVDEQHIVWVLKLYIYSTVSLACSTVALSILRFGTDRSINTVGCWLAIVSPLVVVPMQYLLADTFYGSYTVENGLLVQPVDCVVGVQTCGNGFFDLLCLVMLLAFVPLLVELYLARKRQDRPSPNAVHAVSGPLSLLQPTSGHRKLTTFESNCLDETELRDVLGDLDDYTVQLKGVVHTPAAAISACGFTIIRNRFLIRTKDVVFLLLARFLRGSSLIVWPLQCGQNRTICVAPARRVFLRSINNVEIAPGRGKSLIDAANHPIA